MTGSWVSRRVTLLGFIAALGACASPTNPPNPEFTPIRFAGGAIPLATDRVEITVRPRIGAPQSSADADFIVPPEQIARLWPRERLKAAGGQYNIHYIIDDASAVSKTDETGETVVAVIQVRLVVETPYGIEESGTGARVTSEIRFEGAPNLIDRQQALHRMSQELANSLDERLSQSVQQKLGRYIAGGI